MHAITTSATLGGTGGPVIPPYYSDFVRGRLYPYLYIRQFGTRAPLPAAYGDKVKIANWQQPIKHTGGHATVSAALTAVANYTEAATTVADAVTIATLSADYISGSICCFAGARGYSDKSVMVSRANWFEAALESLTRELCYDLDRYAKLQLCAATTLYNVGGAADVGTATVMRAKHFAYHAAILDSMGVPRYDDGTFVMLTNPLTQYDIVSDTTATGFVPVVRYNNPERIYRGEIGTMYGVRLVTSSAIQKRYGTAGGLSAAASGFHSYMFSRDGFYNIEHAEGGVQVMHHPPGSSGLADVANHRGAVAVKVYYGVAIAPSAETRIIRIAHGKSVTV